MGFPEHLQAALGQLEEHLLQSWQISLDDLRCQNEALQSELAQRPPVSTPGGQSNLRTPELEQEILGLQALYQDSQDRRSEISEQLSQVREQLELEAAQCARLTLEMVDLKLEQERERLRLRGLPVGPPKFNLPDLVDDEKPADQNERLQRLAYQDGETGLPNLNLARLFLQGELAKKEKSTVALAILQVEHWIGLDTALADPAESHRLLTQLAERVRACLRAEDVLARGAGGEFWLIFPVAVGGPLGLKSAAEYAQQSLARLLESLKAPVRLEEHQVLLSFWAGLAVSQGEEDVDCLQQQAMLALKTIQNKGAQRFGLFVKEMEKPGRVRSELVPHLRQALAREQFSLRFQPVVELETRMVKGVEALVRWEHPLKKTLEPAAFLEAACNSGVIMALGDWVMSQVCQLSSEYRSIYWFINLSLPEMMQADLPRRLTKAMGAAHITRPDFIVLECKEADLARNDPRISNNLRELQNWNVGLSVDDFNFAEVSLKSLDRRGFRFLKLSSQISQDLDQLPIRQLVKGGLMAAEAAGARVVLKGLENQGLLDLALQTGNVWGQGYALSPPLTWPEMEGLLVSRRPLAR